MQKLSSLQIEDEVNSDRNVILLGAALLCGYHFTKRKIIVRPIIKKAREAFKTKLSRALLRPAEWTCQYKDILIT